MLVSLFPEPYRTRYRPGIDLYRAAALSGFAESAGCLAVLFVRYVDFLQRRLVETSSAAVANGREDVLGVPAVPYGLGFVTLIDFALHPLTLLLAYLTFEGLVRFLAGAATRETLGSTPLYLAVSIYRRWKQASAG
jgi:hypothetical protein